VVGGGCYAGGEKNGKWVKKAQTYQRCSAFSLSNILPRLLWEARTKWESWFAPFYFLHVFTCKKKKELLRWEKRGEKRGCVRVRTTVCKEVVTEPTPPISCVANPLLLPRYTRKSGSPTVRSSPEPFGLLWFEHKKNSSQMSRLTTWL
jgi:hypothetical protein